ncbi:hypothetical protein PHJA_001362700 [Phtheirospermum japonicum]|uniref:Uncharacterized protein n=1 Tax=Phtheirospermum japonicum TaxID=374723 RepID=A0A830BZD3_9LAMI|nr:hypothetical protein PHJA_001362700 [Phtheirospermum japonicum]
MQALMATRDHGHKMCCGGICWHGVAGIPGPIPPPPAPSALIIELIVSKSAEISF